MKLTSNWKQEIKDYFGISYTDPQDAPGDALWVTRCSKTKLCQLGKSIPKYFYVSVQNLRFYASMESYGQHYGILSDKYGIHFDDEELEFYDIHPSELTAADKQKLGEIIRKKCLERGWTKLIFWNSSPIMSKPYFEILAASKLEIYYTTQLSDIAARLF